MENIEKKLSKLDKIEEKLDSLNFDMHEIKEKQIEMEEKTETCVSNMKTLKRITT